MLTCGACYESINECTHICKICHLYLCNNCAKVASKFNKKIVGFDRLFELLYCSTKCAYVRIFSARDTLIDICDENSEYVASELVKYDQHEQWTFIERKKLIQHTKPLLNHILIDDLINIVLEYIYNQN